MDPVLPEDANHYLNADLPPNYTPSVDEEYWRLEAMSTGLDAQLHAYRTQTDAWGRNRQYWAGKCDELRERLGMLQCAPAVRPIGAALFADVY